MINFFSILLYLVSFTLCTTDHLFNGNLPQDSNVKSNSIKKYYKSTENILEINEYPAQSTTTENFFSFDENYEDKETYFLPTYSRSTGHRINNQDRFLSWNLIFYFKKIFTCCYFIEEIPDFSYTSFKDEDDFEDLVSTVPVFQYGILNTEESVSNKIFNNYDDAWDTKEEKSLANYDAKSNSDCYRDHNLKKPKDTCLTSKTPAKYKRKQYKFKKRHLEFNNRKKLPTIKEDIIYANFHFF